MNERNASNIEKEMLVDVFKLLDEIKKKQINNDKDKKGLIKKDIESNICNKLSEER